MWGFLFVAAIFVGCAASVPAAPSLYVDVYRNILSPSPRIIGGQTAERHQIPYQVSVQWGLLGVYSHICGGSLIKEGWVLTAAHCKAYTLGSYKVVAGQLNQNEEHTDVQTVNVAEFITHPKYPGGSVVAANDVALIRLRTPVTLTDAVQLIPLPTDASCNAIGPALLSGWGLTSSLLPIPPTTLRWTQLPRISNADCAAVLTALLGSSDPLDDSMICTGSNEGTNQSACSGDSGGPVALVSSGEIIGIVSWGISPCGTKGAPTVYTRVCSHLDFINIYI